MTNGHCIVDERDSWTARILGGSFISVVHLEQAQAAGYGNFKEQREAQRKAAAAAGTAPERAAWNSLYMSPDTVAEAVAARLGVDKAAVLDPTAGSVAAQYAKAELEVLHATKSALGDAGAHPHLKTSL